MATVEVDELELAKLARLRDTAAAIIKNPKALLKLQEATKEVFPNAITPELDRERAASTLQTGIGGELDKLRREITDEREQRKMEDNLRLLTQRHESGFHKLREQGWTDSGIEEVRKIMEEKGIVDHDIAAAFYEKQHPPQTPVTPNGRGGWNFLSGVGDEEKDLQKLIETKGENNSLIDKMAYDALTEVRATARR